MGKMVVSPYSYYGLNRKRNFLEAPDCECGCGGKMVICLSDDNELFSFCANVLSDHDCSKSAVFIIRHDGKMQMAIYEPKEKAARAATFENPTTHSFSDFEGTVHLCCYSLLIEQSKGEYMIAE